MRERQGFGIRSGLLASSGLAMLFLLMLFYSTVSGAVDRAARQRAEVGGWARSPAMPTAPAQGRRVAAIDKSGS